VFDVERGYAACDSLVAAGWLEGHVPIANHVETCSQSWPFCLPPPLPPSPPLQHPVVPRGFSLLRVAYRPSEVVARQTPKIE